MKQTLGWLIYLGAVAGIVSVGWNEPLSYRFLSLRAVAQAEFERTGFDGSSHVDLRKDDGDPLSSTDGNPNPSPNATNPPPNMQGASQPAAASWRPMGTALDRAPYNSQNGSIFYSQNYDHNAMGASTETGKLQNKTVSGPTPP